jgi:Mrp family chromosome partitioning ATPase
MVLSRKDMAVAGSEGPVRVVSMWAAPPTPSLLVFVSDGRADAAKALRDVRRKIEEKHEDGSTTFAISSATEQEGKSVLAAQLALALSEGERARVLLVEANLKAPSLAQLLGLRLTPGSGFSSQLVKRMRGGRDPWSVIALGPSLHVLVEEAGQKTLPEAIESKPFQEVVQFVSRGYDYVLLDAPPLLDAKAFEPVAPLADAIVLAGRAGSTRASVVRRALREDVARKVFGMVLWDGAPAGGTAAGSSARPSA